MDWFFICLDNYAVSFQLNYCSAYVTCCFTESDFLYDYKMVIFLYQVHWLIIYLLRSAYFFHLIYCRKFICCCFLCEVISLYDMIRLISYIQFIDWFFTCLDFSVIFFHLYYCSWYVIGYLQEVITLYDPSLS